MVVFSLFALILSVRFYLYFSTLPEIRSGQKISIQYTFLSEPKFTEGNQEFSVGKIKVYTALYPAFHYGDVVLIKGQVSEESFISKQNGKLIRKPFFQIKRFTLRYPEIEKERNKNYLLSISASIRQRVISSFNSLLPANFSSLLLGIIVGGNSGFDNDFYASLRNAGVLHVVAASGMNVSMVGEFLLILFLLFFPRKISLTLTITGIMFYAILSGLAPSIVRAGIMAIMAYSAQVLGRQNYSFFSLLLAAFIMLLISPQLVFDVGFRLSFLSTFGIVYLKPVIDVFMPKKGIFEFFTSDFSTTLSAQMGSLPVLIGGFSSYSLFSVIVNILVLWTIPILMILGGLGAIASLISPSIAMPFVYLCIPFLWFFTTIVSLFGELGVVDFPQIPSVIYIGYLLLIVSLILWGRKKKTNQSL